MKHAATNCKLCVLKCTFLEKAPAEGHCQENRKQIAEHAYFICLSGLVGSGWSSKSGFVSFINTHAHTEVNTQTYAQKTQTHLADSSVAVDVQVNAQEGARGERERWVERQKTKTDKDSEFVRPDRKS